MVCRIIPPLAKKPQPAYLTAAARLPDCLLVAVSESIGRTRFFTLACIMDVQTILALIPATAGYLFKWKQYRQRKTKP
ncbi:Uncharacterised protein [Neisseria gonorrhoeae]|uniref:Uncharacterized protein n=1 Tax=Neisseria gonorrhoeae TaxID=485 RepID=A0A378VW20_NEIGO|nr:Uncharacterised protein [Neisseria gonorrhoeae]